MSVVASIAASENLLAEVPAKIAQQIPLMPNPQELPQDAPPDTIGDYPDYAPRSPLGNADVL